MKYNNRAEKIADEVSYSIPWGRQLQYSVQVLRTRLSLGGFTSSYIYNIYSNSESGNY
jgi:hypothetical protein